ncbi:30S ribosomal protein S6 [Candidatus Roizmanbacteria bacterium]|nr:30S ribosomal protein S6 [Candidatus Roizmanbacteria bacterium]
MSLYEITFLLNEDSELNAVKELISSHGGKIAKENDWGVKRLSYPIKKDRTAHFYNWEFSLEKKNVQELKRKLNFNERLIRYLVLEIETKKYTTHGQPLTQ